MKYLSDYTNELLAKALHDNGAFYAFGPEQFDKLKKEGVEYASMSTGLICPKANADKLAIELQKVIKNGIAADLKENGKAAIIQRELGNHETQITGDISDVVNVLLDYGITEAEVREGYGPFYQMCLENDYF